MTHPIESWPRSGRRRTLIAAIVAALGFSVVMSALDAPLRDTGDGTVALELAGTSGRAQEVVDGWRANDVLDNGAFVDGIDFLYAPIYAIAIAGVCVAGAGAWRRLGRERLAKAGIAIAWLASAALVFDWTEDIALAVVILDKPSSPWPALALGAAIPKFACIAAGLLYALGGGAAALMHARRV